MPAHTSTHPLTQPRTLLENDMAMLTHFGLKLSFVGLYTTKIPLKLYEQSVIFVVKKLETTYMSPRINDEVYYGYADV